VLIDGQRAAPLAFAVNGTDTFFDLNTLPTNMIDRIEIVKTGAVSQYGTYFRIVQPVQSVHEL
jgi:iron complex outermembrane receptor protein